MRPYVQRSEDIVRSQKNTLLVDFRHILEYDQTLAEAIEVRYFRYAMVSKETIRNSFSRLGASPPATSPICGARSSRWCRSTIPTTST